MGDLMGLASRLALLPLETSKAAAGVASGMAYMGACAAARAAGSVASGLVGGDPVAAARGVGNGLSLLFR